MQELFFVNYNPLEVAALSGVGNSFMYTGPEIPAFNVIIKLNFLVQTLMIVVPKYFATILQNNTFPSFSPF